MTSFRLRVLPLVLLLALPSVALAQESKSAGLATQLAQLLDSKKLDTMAAKNADRYVGAIYIPGAELLVVSGTAAVPAREDMLLSTKSYRDIYQDLFSSGDTTTRMFVTDLGANGLRFKNDTPDTVEVAGKTVSFDGDWGKAKISQQEYTKSYTTSDEQYSRMLEALIAAAKGA